MGFLLIVGAIIVGVANMGFNQAKANPGVEHFLYSNSHVIAAE